MSLANTWLLSSIQDPRAGTLADAYETVAEATGEFAITATAGSVHATLLSSLAPIQTRESRSDRELYNNAPSNSNRADSPMNDSQNSAKPSEVGVPAPAKPAEQTAATEVSKKRTHELRDIISKKCTEWPKKEPIPDFAQGDTWAKEIAEKFQQLERERYTMIMRGWWSEKLLTWAIVSSSPDEATRELIRAYDYDFLKSKFMKWGRVN
jgi:hypothetical protein